MKSKPELIEMYETLTNGAEAQLKPGMLAKWKPGMKNKKKPEYGEPAVVVQRIAPITDKTDSSGSAYFNEPLDIQIGIIDRDGDFMVLHYDSRRFMPA